MRPRISVPYGVRLDKKSWKNIATKEALVEENPEYFYDILPYTYVLDVSSKWMNKFESLTMSAPTWYSSEDDRAFDYIMFSHFMSSTMSTAMTSMTSTPSSSSGGGFSGGGSGGGGGGSW